MRPLQKMRRLRVYIGENARHNGRPLYEALVEEARKRGMAGATVFRGSMGFGASSLVHVTRILRLSEDLPVVVEVLDRPQRIECFAESIEPLIGKGVLSIEDVEAAFFCPLRILDVMRLDPACVTPETPLAQVLETLIAKGCKSVPVVREKKVLGLITGGNLLLRTGMSLRLSLQRSLSSEEQAALIRELAHEGKNASDIMSSPAVTINVKSKLPEAIQLMAENNLKRLPVIDDLGDLVGIVSRIDIMRVLASVTSLVEDLPDLPPGMHLKARDIMFKDVTVVSPETPLAETAARVISSPFRRAVVVDEQNVVLGIVLDGDLFRLFQQKSSHDLAQDYITGRSMESFGRDLIGSASDVMRKIVFSVGKEAPLGELLREMVRTKAKRLVVVDADGRLAGMVDRDRLIKALGAS
jgi:CBS domain-containing protein/PII-like signaling protein